MAQVVIRRPLKAEASVRFKGIPSWIYGGQMWICNRPLPQYFCSTLSVSFRKRSILIFISCRSYQKNGRSRHGNLQKGMIGLNV
jgi:hypothetical protein